MRRVLTALVAVVLVGCTATPTQPVVESPAGSPAPGTGSAGGTHPECDAGDEECFIAVVEDAIDRAGGISSDVEIELQQPRFEGGQRTDSMVNYLVDTVFLLDAFWSAAFGAGGVPYTHINYVVLDAGDTAQQSNCTDQTGAPGTASADSGPFYCAIGGRAFGSFFESGTVYLAAPWFLTEPREVNPSNFDFAVVAVIAHEFGHHVQHVLLRAALVTPTTATWFELGADCLAGVFAHYAYYGQAGQLTDTDVEEAAALMWNIGSDLPYDWGGDPHGSRQQRVGAFMLGYNDGNTSRCFSEAWPTGF